jgi:serine/threonine protein kinase
MGLRFGRYETLQPIAAGGMAKVYRGRALGEGGFERIVAIKVMHSNLASDPGFVDMFLDEARLAAKIQHPNVVATYDVQRSPVGTFLVMDYVEGVDFGQLQRALRNQDTKLPIEIALKVVIDALAGLGAAHELLDTEGAPLQLVHRDVSPQNILIDRNTGTVKLTDFGVAHAAERLSSTESGALKGKLGYLSPEHARDGSVDLRSDIYSAGVVLWEALAGRPMFVGRARVRVIADILQGRLDAPCFVDDRVPKELSSTCMKALSLLPEDRFQSAAEFAAALRTAARLDGIEIADREAVRAFIQASGIEPASQRQRERRAEDEQTVVESEPRAPVARSEAKEPRSRRVWVMAACAVATVGLLPLLEQVAQRRADPAHAVAPLLPKTETRALTPGFVSEPEAPGAAAPRPADALQPPFLQADGKGRTRKPAVRRKDMYHPKGL